ncbi:MAG: amt [Burkholderiaceae bacterium]|nr:amt [Burkholderiaceae bacterium]
MKKIIASMAAIFALVAALGFSLPALAADAPTTPSASATVSTASASTPAAVTAAAPAAAAEAPAPTPNKADTAWIMVCTVLVILMSLPGIALFYGGLVRSKNMLSVLMQSFSIFALIIVLWCIYGYSLAFTEGNSFIGGFDRLFLNGIFDSAKASFSTAATFSKGVVLPEYVYVVFQGAFAAITCCLIIGSFAERIKFSALMVFIILWFTFSYLPMAHMVWFWTGPDAIKDAATLATETEKAGLLFQKGALDFAGGTVVHINAAIAGLIGSYFVGKRIGLGKDSMAPHSLTMTMIGAALLWVGWFGFNAGSALEANDTAALAFVNTLLATAAATCSWVIGEWFIKKHPSMLGGASGAVAGLVAVTPACGFIGPMGALVIGLLAGLVCLWGVTGLKKLLGADDSLDVFGVHGVGGIMGALLTGVFAAPSLGGQGIFDYVINKASTDPYSIASQVWVQFQAVIICAIWSAVVSIIAYKLIDMVIGLRVSEDEEREGLDITTHGESAYKL